MHHVNSQQIKLQPGMVFTIEPILVEGSRRIGTWADGWTAATFDGGWYVPLPHRHASQRIYSTLTVF